MLLAVTNTKEIKTMLNALKKNWTVYLIEAWGLGLFMIAAVGFVILIEHPSLPIRTAVPSDFVRRILIGIIMGLTAIGIIYSGWGKRSGAHINPAVTLAQYQLDRINGYDAVWYIIFQFFGSIVGIAFMKILLPTYIADPSVNYVVTTPIATDNGIFVGFFCEIVMSFIMLTIVLHVSNHKTWANYTGYFIGFTAALFITIAAPFSGMSINPARTVGSALWANVWTGMWLYFIAPISGMQIAAWVYRKQYRVRNGECETLKIHLSGNKHACSVYEVLWHSRMENNVMR
jgi:aquaporin Z